MKTIPGSTILRLLLLGIGITAISRADAAAVNSGTVMSPAITNKPATVITPQSAGTIRMNANTTFKQLLAMPDATVVQSADGKQSTTVGAIRAGILARQRAVQTALQTGKYITGGKITVTSPLGVKAAASLRERLTQENSVALSLRSANLNQPSLVYEAQHPTPGIYTVNGKKTGFVLSPGANVIIKGAGFGNAKSVAVIRGLPKGDIELTVVNWHDNEIWAQIPATPNTMSGLPDGAVAVVVYGQHNGTQQYRLDGGTFYANRADFIVTGGTVTRFFQMQFDPNAPALEPVSNFTPPGDYERDFYDIGDDPSKLNRCWSPGTDYLTTIDPGRGFVVTALTFTWGPTDSGNGDLEGREGDRTFAPGYSLGDWNGNTLPVRWGVWHMHTSPHIFDPSYDDCISEYVVTSVILTGPAGISPF